MFDKKSVFIFATPDMDLEELELELIDAGLEELEEHDGEVTVLAEYNEFGAMVTKLEELKIEPTKAVRQRFATSPHEFSEAEMEDIEKMLDKMDEDDDIQEVFTNIAH